MVNADADVGTSRSFTLRLCLSIELGLLKQSFLGIMYLIYLISQGGIPNLTSPFAVGAMG